MKTFFALAILLAPSFVFAYNYTLQTDCGSLPLAQQQTCLDEQATIRQRNQGGPIPTEISMPWGLKGGETPTVKAGTVVTDEHGIAYDCPIIFVSFQCYDLTRTDYYRNQMRELGRQLIANGRAPFFPSLKGWIDSVR